MHYQGFSYGGQRVIVQSQEISLTTQHLVVLVKLHAVGDRGIFFGGGGGVNGVVLAAEALHRVRENV